MLKIVQPAEKCTMSSVKADTRGWLTFRPTALVGLLSFLLVCSPVVQQDLDGNGTPSSSCTPCSNSGCPNQNSCLQECIRVCPDNFYQITGNSSFICQPPTTNPAAMVNTSVTFTTRTNTLATFTTGTNTSATLTTETNTSATFPTETHTPTAAETAAQNGSSVSNNTAANRRRRQVVQDNTTMDGTTTDEQTTDSITTTVPTTLPTTVPTTVPTTTTAPKVICKECSIDFCDNCKDDVQHNTVCKVCRVGYHLSSDLGSCIEDKDDKFPVGAIVGIVIGGVCFIVLVVVAVCLARRYCKSADIAGPHAGKNIESKKLEEEPELQELGYAPAPPQDDPSKRYDSLQTKGNEESSYSALQTSNEPVYANLQTAGIHPNQSHYANEQHAGKLAGNLKSNEQQKLGSSHKSTSSESAEFYEPIDSPTVDREPQEIYENTDSKIAAQRISHELAQKQEIYANDDQDNMEEVYENENVLT